MSKELDIIQTTNQLAKVLEEKYGAQPINQERRLLWAEIYTVLQEVQRNTYESLRSQVSDVMRVNEKCIDVAAVSNRIDELNKEISSRSHEN